MEIGRIETSVRVFDDQINHFLILPNMDVIFYNVVTNIPNAPQTYHLVNNSGEDVVKAMTARARELGVTIKTAAPVK